jgi:hypothetical protein
MRTKGINMSTVIPLENIEELRREQGIDDVDLRMEIRTLKVGDFVKLTFLTGTAAFETLSVRITSIRGSAFRGKLVKRPHSSGLSDLQGAPILFTTAHIHSLIRKQEVHG